MPTDSKTTFKIFKTQTQKLPLKTPKPKISLKSLGGGTLRYLDIRVLGYMGTGT